MANNKVLMPNELTAENDAKFLLSGEFSESIEVICPECNGDDSEDCDECFSAGTISLDVPVSWSTIKNIYALAVEKLSIKTKRNNTHIIAPLEPTEAMIIAAAGEGYSLEDKELVTKEYKAILATLTSKL